MPTLDRLLRQRDRLAAVGATRAGRLVVRLARGLALVGVLAFLVVQVSALGWERVVEGLPRTPWFYLLVLAIYGLLPLTETLVFGRLWGVAPTALLGASLRKRTLNAEVAGYSGDVYFCWWAQQRFGLAGGLVWRTYKDNAILSAAASFLAVALLLAGLWFSGQVAFADVLRDRGALYAGVGVGLLAVVLAAVVGFRRVLFSLPSWTVGALLGVHLGRFFLAWTLQIVQWWVVLPEAPLEVWGTILAVMTVINRLPLLPARDLLGIGAVLGMSELLAASEVVIAGMLLARSAIDRLLNVALFGGTLLWERSTASARPRPEEVAESLGVPEGPPRAG